MLIVAPALFLSLPTSVRTESACEALRDWARPYENATPTLDELAQFDRSHRIAIFNAVTPSVRAALVQDHLRRFSQRADLSNAQRALIAEAITLATPELYTKDSPAGPAFKAFWARANPMFTTPDERQPWFNLGPVVAGSTQLTFTSTNSGPRPLSPVISGAACRCTQDAYDPSECGGATCISASCSEHFGCGPGFAYWCNGMCG